MVMILVLLGVVALVVTLYNRFVRLRNGADAAWSDIDVQLKRRWELVPNLVETVKGYAPHERATLEDVTKARGALRSASLPSSKKSRRFTSNRPATRLPGNDSTDVFRSRTTAL